MTDEGRSVRYGLGGILAGMFSATSFALSVFLFSYCEPSGGTCVYAYQTPAALFLVLALALLITALYFVVLMTPEPIFAPRVRRQVSPEEIELLQKTAGSEAVPVAQERTCQYCGLRSPAGTTFCGRCHRPLSWSKSARATTTSP